MAGESQIVRVKAKPVPKIRGNKQTNRRLWAEVCYYYPQYTLKEASQLSARDIRLLLKTASRLEATRFYNLTQIASAPHSEKGKGVKELIDHFQREMRK